MAWRDLPFEFGPWQTVWKRHKRFSSDGTWDDVLTALLAQADAAGEIDWAVSIDSTINRAHQHAATLPRTTGAQSNHMNQRLEPRYDKLATLYRGGAVLAAVLAWLRHGASPDLDRFGRSPSGLCPAGVAVLPPATRDTDEMEDFTAVSSNALGPTGVDARRYGAAAAYQELRRRLGQRLVEEEQASDTCEPHWTAYRLAMEEPSLHRLLLDVVRGEPNEGMALSPVFAVIEGDDPALSRLALDVLEPGSREQLMAEQRARDVVLVRAAAAGDASSGEPADTWSPWAQRQACRTATDLRVLDLLGSNGISRHVRAQATERARRRRKEAASQS